MSKQTRFDRFAKATQAVWAGEDVCITPGRASEVPVVHSVSIDYDDLDIWYAVATERQHGHIYCRNSNPTVAVFEQKLRILEGAQAATSFASGMAAISNTLLALLSPGDRVVAPKDCYGGTSKTFLEHLPRFGIHMTLCETTDFEQIEAAVAEGCKLLYIETPTNPMLKVMDIARLARAAHAAGAWVVVDNTVATPLLQSPLQLGADLVVHSATKYLGGHADVMGGAVCGSAELVRKVYDFRQINGACLSPMSAYMLIRGIKTLELRVMRQCENAMKIAKFLESHPKVSAVHYPGLASHPQHEIARRQMRAFGGMLSFELTGGWEAVEAFLPKLELAHLAANLGALSTIAGPPRTTSHVECTPQQRAELGIPEALVRYSVGIEDADDLIGDLDRALSQLG